MDQLAGILFKVDMVDLNAMQRPAHDQRLARLRDLVRFRQVGIEIVLAIELRTLVRSPARGKTDFNDVFDRLLVGDRKRPGMAHTDRADVHVRMFLVRIVQRIAEHLCPRLKLGVNLKSNGWLVIVHKCVE
jgi:hypothetical protein